MNVNPGTLRQLDLALEMAEAMNSGQHERWDELVRTPADLLYVAQANSAMFGEMVREEAVRAGLPLNEVWANVRRTVLLAAGV